MKIIFLFVILLKVFYIKTQSVDTCKFKLITDFSQTDCINQATETDTFFYKKSDNCIPLCTKYTSSTEQECDETSKPCDPGYICSNCSNNVCHCAIDKGSCMIYYANTTDFRNTYYSALKFKPTCLNDGSWAPKQCKGGKDGRCICFDAKGNRIFGEAPNQQYNDITCACSRKKADLIAAGIRSYTTLHCDTMGNYEPLQCNDGQCWCAEPKTGDLVSPVVPEMAMKKLPCYDVSKTGKSYLRICDSRLYAQYKIGQKLKWHGVDVLNFEFVKCDDDGSYGHFKWNQGKYFCTNKDGTSTSYSIEPDQPLESINCNCARDFVIYHHNKQCNPIGSYEETQKSMSRNVKYCVDQDGFAKTDTFTGDLNCSATY